MRIVHAGDMRLAKFAYKKRFMTIHRWAVASRGRLGTPSAGDAARTARASWSSPHPSHSKTPPWRAGFCSLWKVTNAGRQSPSQFVKRFLVPTPAISQSVHINGCSSCSSEEMLPSRNRVDVVRLFGRKRQSNEAATRVLKHARGCLVEGVLRIDSGADE
jgi:hypothetical protein